MNLPSDNDFALTRDNNHVKNLQIQVSELTEEVERLRAEAIQASQTLMQLVSENFNLKDQNQALIAENERVIYEYDKCKKKLDSVTSIGNRLIEIIEEMQE